MISVLSWQVFSKYTSILFAMAKAWCCFYLKIEIMSHIVFYNYNCLLCTSKIVALNFRIIYLISMQHRIVIWINTTLNNRCFVLIESSFSFQTFYIVIEIWRLNQIIVNWNRQASLIIITYCNWYTYYKKNVIKKPHLKKWFETKKSIWAFHSRSHPIDTRFFSIIFNILRNNTWLHWKSYGLGNYM